MDSYLKSYTALENGSIGSTDGNGIPVSDILTDGSIVRSIPKTRVFSGELRMRGGWTARKFVNFALTFIFNAYSHMRARADAGGHSVRERDRNLIRIHPYSDACGRV